MRKVYRGCHQIVNRRQARFAQYIVIEDAEILKVRVAIAKGAVQRDQGEEFLQVFVYMYGIRELAESLHDRGFITAPILFVRPAGVEYAEILESTVCSVGPQIEAVDDESQAIFGKTKGRRVESAAARGRETEVLIGGELRSYSAAAFCSMLDLDVLSIAKVG